MLKRCARPGLPSAVVKGAYQEPAEVAYPEKADVDAAYVRQAQRMLRGTRETGVYAQFGTQDPKMIAVARAYAAANGIPASAWEVQMLHWCAARPAGLPRARACGRIYIPYGTEWIPTSCAGWRKGRQMFGFC